MATGIDEVNSRMQDLIDRLSQRAERAATRIAMTIEAYSMALTPVDTSNLINSIGRNIQPLGNKVVGTVYYGAQYAKWVHNMPGKLKGQPRADFGTTRTGVAFGGGTGKGRYWDPNAEPQFLKKAGDRAAREDAPDIIRQEMSL